MNIERTRVGRDFWLMWVVASAVGLAVGLAVFFPLVVDFAAEQGIMLQILISVVGGAALGASIGITQSLVLRRKVPYPYKWVMTSTVGGAVGGVVALAVGEALGEIAGFVVALVVGGAVIGAALGTAQWLILRRQLYQAGWWVLTNTVGLAMGFALGRGLGETVYYLVLGVVGEDLARIAATVTFGILLLIGFGAITGSTLLWLLRQPPVIETAS